MSSTQVLAKIYPNINSFFSTFQDGERWCDICVTQVIDACHFWAHVGGKLVVEKVEAINRKLLSQVTRSFVFELIPSLSCTTGCTWSNHDRIMNAFQWINLFPLGIIRQLVSLKLNRWNMIYLANSAIQRLKNRGLLMIYQ